MADLTRSEELVQSIERDETFRTEVDSAPTMTAKRQVLDAHGFHDVGFDDMRAYVESKGGKLEIPDGNRELSDDELAAVAGGLTDGELTFLWYGGFAAASAAVAAA